MIWASREGLDLPGPDQLQRANAVPIGEGDMLPVRFQAPARRFVLNRAIILLEAGVAFLARFMSLDSFCRSG